MSYYHIDFENNNMRHITEEGLIWLMDTYKRLIEGNTELNVVAISDVNSSPLTEEDFKEGSIVIYILLRKFTIPIGYNSSIFLVKINDWTQWQDSIRRFEERDFRFEIIHWFSEGKIITLNTEGWNGKW